MGFRKTALAAALAMSMASTPVLAQTSASSLSLAGAQRAGAGMDEASNQTFNSDWIVPGLIVLGVIVTLVLIYTEDDEEGVSA